MNGSANKWNVIPKELVSLCDGDYWLGGDRLGRVYFQTHEGTQENHEGRGMGTAIRQVQGQHLRFQNA